MQWRSGIERIRQWTDYSGTNRHDSIGKTVDEMRQRRERIEVDDGILRRHTDNTGQPLELLKASKVIISRIEKRCRNARGRSSGVGNIPQDALLGKELRQGRQA